MRGGTSSGQMPFHRMKGVHQIRISIIRAVQHVLMAADSAFWSVRVSCHSATRGSKPSTSLGLGEYRTTATERPVASTSKGRKPSFVTSREGPSKGNNSTRTEEVAA